MKTAANQPEAIHNRKQALPIKVFCTPDERQTIIGKAKQCGLSVSHYLRAIGLGLSNTRIHDACVTDELIKTKVELGRILSLLRLCLTQAENFPLESRPGLRETVTDVIQDVEANQASLKVLIQRAVKS